MSLLKEQVSSWNIPVILERIKNWYVRRPTGTRIFLCASLIVLIGGIGFFLYCWHISSEIDRRFSGRRWSIPSKVFSDTTILYPGQQVNMSLFREKLKRLGYREVGHAPERSGEMRSSVSAIEIYLHDLEMPSGGREGFPVRIAYWRDRIQAIFNSDSGESMPILELEPEEIALLFGPERERRRLVSLDQVPEHLIRAVLCAEDRRFYDHRGVDPRGILRAFYTNIRRGGIVQGGSTITQQLAKCYFLYPKRSLPRKLKEALMSLIIEMKYDKDEILEIYLNEIYLGQRGSASINGVGEASHFYFGKDVGELSAAEAACLAGLIKAPNRYSPYVDRERCRRQKDTVLQIMHENGWLSDDDLKTALASPLEPVGFSDFGKQAPYFVDYLLEQLVELYPSEALASLGLSIYTALDTQVQVAAERALERGLTRLEESNPALIREQPEKRVQGTVIVIQPKTGYVLAMVGGRDYGASQFNRATQARRQPGSAFKPLVFASSLDKLTPASKLSNEHVTYEVDGKTWEPQNFIPVPQSHMRVREALVRSVNIATVDLAMQTGLDRIVDTVNSFRFSTPVKPYPSLALGAFEVIPVELARAYCVFAADGALPYPLSLKAVVDEGGTTLERRHMTVERVLSPAKAYVMTSMLRTVVTDGTARSLRKRGISFPAAGKTGTTNGFRDAWFVGYTPNVLTLVWVGFDNEDSIETTGSGAALPIWADLMKSIPQYTSESWLARPPGVVDRTVCSESGKLAMRGCPGRIQEVFLEENVPVESCPLHGGLFKGFGKYKMDDNDSH